MPVIHSGELPFAHFPLITMETTVQTDAERISTSPRESPPDGAPTLIANMPQKPTSAPRSFETENRSSRTNKNEKQENKSGAICFRIAVLPLSVMVRPT